MAGWYVRMALFDPLSKTPETRKTLRFEEKEAKTRKTKTKRQNQHPNRAGEGTCFVHKKRRRDQKASPKTTVNAACLYLFSCLGLDFTLFLAMILSYRPPNVGQDFNPTTHIHNIYHLPIDIHIYITINQVIDWSMDLSGKWLTKAFVTKWDLDR